LWPRRLSFLVCVKIGFERRYSRDGYLRLR
jgi:hypothetical protein